MAKRRQPKAPVSSAPGEWHFDELPATAQEELLQRMADADVGRGVFDFDEAIADDDRLTDRILKLTHPPDSRSP
jgi:hypothetical protein